MSSSDNPGGLDEASRTVLLRQVVDDCLRRRSSGEWVTDENLIAAHPELMPELRQELRKLALVERARRQAVATPASSEISQGVEPPAAELPDWFEGYQTVREIHRGGQGVVYQAIQLSTHRKVAIKVMKEGPFAGAADRARFEREVQILGQLNHPNIVAIHDTGEIQGCHYFVMDYISGQPLDAYMAERTRSIGETLTLLSRICEAVHAAHLRGIIHRDLKPGNIRIDADGQPHILDFGLAKVGVSEAETPLMTLTGQFVGSLPWASPEQAEGEPAKIDVRTDVYSLGVILYQMLTGHFPYEVVGNMRDVLDRIMQAEPVRPSTLRRQINDEVETIVLKCLQKERERRYQSAGELGRDIRHYLAGEPIEAKRDSVGYVLRKHLRKYRVPVALVAAFLIVVTSGFFTSLAFWRQAAVARDEAEAINNFLQQMLASADPVATRGQDVSVRVVLDQAVQELDAGALASRPEVEAAVRTTIGRTYISLGLFPEAKHQLQSALAVRRRLFGNQHALTAETLNALAWSLKELGEFAEAEALYREALGARRGMLGEEHLDVAETLNGLGQLLYVQKKHADAEPLLRQSLALRQRLGAPEREVASSMANLGSLLRDMGRLNEAEGLLREALAIRRRLFGPDHVHTVVSMNKLALLLLETGAIAEARTLAEEALPLRARLVGETHPDYAASLNTLALCLFKEGRYEEAIPLFRRAVEVYRGVRRADHPHVGQTTLNLARCQMRAQHFEAAEQVFLNRHAELLTLVDPAHPQMRALADGLVELYTGWGKPAEAERWHALGPAQSSKQDLP